MNETDVKKIRFTAERFGEGGALKAVVRSCVETEINELPGKVETLKISREFLRRNIGENLGEMIKKLHCLGDSYKPLVDALASLVSGPLGDLQVEDFKPIHDSMTKTLARRNGTLPEHMQKDIAEIERIQALADPAVRASYEDSLYKAALAGEL